MAIVQRRHAILLLIAAILPIAVVGLLVWSFISLPTLDSILVDCYLPELNPPGRGWEARCRCSDIATWQADGTNIAQGACWAGTFEPAP